MKTLLLLLTGIAFITCAYLFQENTPYILQCIQGLGWLAPFLFLLLYCLGTILLLPTLILTLAGGAIFGPILGTIINLLGATIGATLAFFISRYWAIGWFESQRGPKIDRLITGVERRGWQFVALLRLLPILPFNVVNYGLGMTKIKFSHYILATFLFIIPTEIIYTYCGHAGMGILQHPDPIYRNSALILAISLLLLFITSRIIRQTRRKGPMVIENQD